MRPDLVASLHIILDFSDTRPLPTQVAEQIKLLIQQGVVKAGEHIPSTRVLSQQLNVSRGTIVAGYELLAAEGYVVSARGSGTQINPQLAKFPQRWQEKRKVTGVVTQQQRQVVSLRPGEPDTASLVSAAWRAAWRKACNQVDGTLEPAGSSELRQEISEYVRQMRGLIVEPERIIVTAGAREGFMLFLQAVSDINTIGMESPGYPSLRKIPPTLNRKVINIATDNNGINPAELDDTLDAAVVTPSHQYPYGGSLSGNRRIAVADWAQRGGKWIIEDDFDSELRYVGQPLPALATLAPDNTLLLGTFSTSLAPAIACGYLIAPAAVIPQLLALRKVFGQPVNKITQLALAQYLASGALRRRTQQLRRTYRRRRSIVTSILGDIHRTTLRPITGGLHAVLLCETPAKEIVQRSLIEGVAVTALHDYWGGTDLENGIVFGFGAHNDDTLEWALNELAFVLTTNHAPPTDVVLADPPH